MSFASLNLHSNITKAVSLCGYTKPTPIQSNCIPPILDKRDIIASAETGTGKTAAFILPALHRLTLNNSSNKARLLVLTPTRELAHQIMDAANKYGKFLKLNVISLVGGTSYKQQFKNLSRNVDIIIATPGRLLDHMKNHRLDISQVEMLVLDEADRMLDMGFFDDVEEIAKKTPHNRQTLLFTATVNHRIESLFKKFLKNPVSINITGQKRAPSHIKQELYMTDNIQHKQRLLNHFLTEANIFKAIIFTATKINADKLAQTLNKAGHAALALHGDLKQNVRNRTIEQFRRGKVLFLVATDVAARGLDIDDVSHVINFDLPRFSEDYVHRIGRTGRAGKSGHAISFALPSDSSHLKKIERYIDQPVQREVIKGMEPTLTSSHANKPKKDKHRSKHKKKSFASSSYQPSERHSSKKPKRRRKSRED